MITKPTSITDIDCVAPPRKSYFLAIHQAARISRSVLTLGVAVAVLGVAQQSHAAIIIWDGSDNSDWLNDANWVGGTAPANNNTSDIAHFNLPTYGGNPVWSPVTGPDNVARAINGITIGSDNGAMTISTGSTGGRLNIGSGGITVAAGAGALTISGAANTSGVFIGANQTWTNDSSSLLSWRNMSTLNSGGDRIVTFAGTGSGGFAQESTTTNRVIQQGTSSTLSLVVDYAGSGNVLLKNTANTYTGSTTLTQGRLSISSDGNISGTASALIFNGGTLQITGTTLTSLNPLRTTTFNAGKTVGFQIDNIANTFTVSQNLNQTTGGLTKTGAGTLALSNANTYTGTTAVGAGTLALGNVNALQNSTLNTGTSGAQAVTFTVAGTNTYSLGGLQGTDALDIGSNTISVGANGSSSTFSGAITGTGGLTKVGSGALTLSSATNTYSGATTVSGGTLYVSGALSNSAVSVLATGTLGSYGQATLGNGLAIAAGGNLDLTGASLASNSVGIFSISSGSLTLDNLTFQNIIGWDWANADVGTYELIDGSFDVNFGSTAYLDESTAYNFGNGKKGYFTQGSLNAVIVAIPEPNVAALLGGLGTLLLLRRRR